MMYGVCPNMIGCVSRLLGALYGNLLEKKKNPKSEKFLKNENVKEHHK